MRDSVVAVHIPSCNYKNNRNHSWNHNSIKSVPDVKPSQMEHFSVCRSKQTRLQCCYTSAILAYSSCLSPIQANVIGVPCGLENAAGSVYSLTLLGLSSEQDQVMVAMGGGSVKFQNPLHSCQLEVLSLLASLKGFRWVVEGRVICRVEAEV